MALAIFLSLCAAVFPIQLYLCFHDRKVWIKIFPLTLVIVYVVCCLIVISMPENTVIQPDGRLAAVIALFIGLSLLAADGLAWLIWCVVKFTQKMKK